MKRQNAQGDEPKKKKKKGASGNDGSTPRAKLKLPPHKYILAPMVGGSELAFRLLCRRYASRDLLCYTPMISSERFAVEPEYRKEAFQTCAEDRPLVAHFSANDPKKLLAAARYVEGRCDAIDLNLGCPQRIAHSGHFGSYLLDDVDRPLVCSIVKTLSEGLKSTPVFVKIRLLATTEKTIELVTQLRDAGASLVAIHARHRVNLVGRSGPGARDGPALLEEVAKVVQAVKGVVIVANGNVKSWRDVQANLASTGASGIMSAEGILDDPTLFLPSAGEDGALGASSAGAPAGAGGGGDDDDPEEHAAREARKVRKKLREIDRLEAKELELQAKGQELPAEEKDKVSKRKSLQKELKKINAERAAAEAAEQADPAAAKAAKAERAAKAEAQAKAEAEALAKAQFPPKPKPLALALEYLALAERHGVVLRTVVFHTRRMAKEALVGVQLLAELLDASDVPAVRKILEEAARREREGYVPDPERLKAEREALELKKWREQTRKRFEERMVRKAKRAGLAADYYLKEGSEVPTAERLRELKDLPKDAAWAQWKTRHGQHCWAQHMDGGCTRERTCAFLHADVAKNADPEWHG